MPSLLFSESTTKVFPTEPKICQGTDSFGLAEKTSSIRAQYPYPMKNALSPLIAFALTLTCLPVAAQRGGDKDKLQEPGNFQDRPAQFTLTTDVVNKDVPRFTATLGTFGNTLILRNNGAMEPYQFRDRIWAEQDAADRIYSGGWSSWGTLKSGFLDGADVMVFRPVNGRMKLVRQDRVTEGGSVSEDWRQYRRNETVKPATTSYTFAWDEKTEAGHPVWLTIYAIDKAGNFSEPAEPVQLTSGHASSGKPQNETFRYDTPRRAKDTEAPAPPKNLKAEPAEGDLVKLSWDPSPSDDLQGYLLGFTDSDPTKHRGEYLELAGKAESPEQEIKKGDWVVVSKEIRKLAPEMISVFQRKNDRMAPKYYPLLVHFNPYETPGKTWDYADHPEDTPVENPGATYLELTLPEGESAKLQGKDLSTDEQSWYNVPLNQDYVVEVWMKADSADAKPVKFFVDGSSKDVGNALPSFTFQPTTEWQKFEKTVTAKLPKEGGVGWLTLEFEGPGNYSIDNYRVYRADVPYLAFLPEDVERIEKSGISFLRTHGPIKTGTDTYSMEQFTNDGGAVRGIKSGNTLPQMLAAFKQAGVDPWLQIEMHMSPQEWLGFVEYMAAPYDPATDTPEAKPWAHKRYTQGYEKPWTEEFDHIYFEIANETWNWTFNPWVFEAMTDGATGEEFDRGAVYGLFNDWVIEQLRASDYWTDAVEEKFEYIIGGWLRSNYGWNAVKAGEYDDYHTIANYIRGWDGARYDEKIASASPINFFELLQYAYQGTIPTARTNVEHYLELKQAGQDTIMGTYEAGPGYSFGNAQEDRAQELIGKSKAAGTATLDNFLMLARYGFDLHNFFTYSPGRRWTSHAENHWGGQMYPSFLALSLFNNHATGDLLEVKAHSMSTVDMPGRGRTQEVINAPLADVYAMRDGDRVSIFCLSREFPGFPDENSDGFTQFQVKLPFTSAKKITLYKMSGELTDNNIREENVKIEQYPMGENISNLSVLTIDENTGGDSRGLPPGETFLYVFEGTDIGEQGEIIPLQEILQRPMGFEPVESE